MGSDFRHLPEGAPPITRAQLAEGLIERAMEKADEILYSAELRARELIDEAERQAMRTREAAAKPPADQPPADEPPVALARDPEPDGRPAPLDLATIGPEALESLGCSVTQARRIVEYRSRLGGFRTVDDLDRVPGLPDPRRADLKRRLVVGDAPAARFSDAA